MEIREVTVYEIDYDGRTIRFDSIKDVKKYLMKQEELSALDAILIDKKPYDERFEFTNGSGYIQQDPEAVEKYRKYLGTIIKNNLNQEAFNSYDNGNNAFWAREYDGTHEYRAWCRLQNIDEKSREYGQRYYRSYPEKLSGGQLNKEN